MSALVRHLSRYADYHRDGHNVATHMVGIPLIVLGVATLLSRPALGTVGEVAITPAMPVAALAALFYLRLDAVFGAVMAVLLALCVWAGGTIAGVSTSWWLTTGLGAFAIGWAFQFVGHYFEGRKPAFVDDLSGLAIGPLFVVAEIGFLLGLRLHVKEAMFDDAVARGVSVSPIEIG